jgi:hypothetical protein
MIVRRPLPDASPSETGIDFSTFALGRGRGQPDKIALVEGDTRERQTYAEFIRQVDATAGGLVRLGLRRSDVVARSVGIVADDEARAIARCDWWEPSRP